MRSFLRKAALVFIAMVVLDIVFALYIVEASSKQMLAASFWAAAIQVCNVFVVVSYVNDKRMVVPCTLGAFVGTWLAIAYI